MKYKSLHFFSRAVFVFLLACQSRADTISYSTLADCKEQVDNDNAAFSELRCKSVGAYQLAIKQQSPQYFTITLSADGKSASSELETITQELPMEPGKAIEWHSNGKQPRFMIFRLKAEIEGNAMKEYLTLSLVTATRICPLASIATAKNPNANQKARDLIAEKFAAVNECPAEIIRF